MFPPSRYRVARLGAVKDRWRELLVSRKFIVTDKSQNRAIDIVDDIVESDAMKSHKSSPKFVYLSCFDLSVFRPERERDASTELHHDAVAQYTRNIAEENRRLLERQRMQRLGHVVQSPPPPPLQQPKQSLDTLNQAKVVEEKNVGQPDQQNSPTVQPIPIIYLFGSVGRGKTLIMDTMYEVLRTEKNHKIQRYHFFELMKQVHAFLASGESITEAGNFFANNVDILCIDEVAITDIQDATIFPSLIEIFIKRKCALIMTSNQHPQRLYSGGLNRHIYLPPFLRLLRDSGCRLVSLDDEAPIDFRRHHQRKLPSVWGRKPIHDSTHFPSELPEELIPLSPTRVMILHAATTGSNSVHANMTELGSENFFESDYLKLCEYLKSQKKQLEISIDTPFTADSILGPARRFGKLVEILYDQQCDVIFLSNFEVDEIFSNIRDTTHLSSAGLVGESVGSQASSLASSAVDEGVKSIERCVSRLYEAWQTPLTGT